MKETRMPPAYSANLVANSGNTIYGVSVIIQLGKKFVEIWIKIQPFFTFKNLYLKMPNISHII